MLAAPNETPAQSMAMGAAAGGLAAGFVLAPEALAAAAPVSEGLFALGVKYQGIINFFRNLGAGLTDTPTPSPRFVAGSSGEVLDTAKIIIPGPRNSAFGKLDYLLGNVGTEKSVGKGGFFQGVLGFDKNTLASALKAHLIDNFAKATVNGRVITAIGKTTGANGMTATIKTVWQIGYDGSINLITAVPAK
jgi:hypothetical protein